MEINMHGEILCFELVCEEVWIIMKSMCDYSLFQLGGFVYFEY